MKYLITFQEGGDFIKVVRPSIRKKQLIKFLKKSKAFQFMIIFFSDGSVYDDSFGKKWFRSKFRKLNKQKYNHCIKHPGIPTINLT